MKPSRNVQINLAIPEQYRNLLRRMAAERMMSDPSQVVTGASIATELLLAALKDIGNFDYEEEK
jgi:hypothetical protein